MTTLPSSHSRDAALHRLSRCNRWLLAGSVTLTGAFTAIAAQAFPGKTHTRASTPAKGSGTSPKTTRAVHKSSPTKALAAPAQAPEAQTTPTEQTTTPTAPTETPQTTEAPTSSESPSESSSAPESGSSSESSSALESSSAPVVSGGS